MTNRYLLRLIRKGYADEIAIADGPINDVRHKAISMLRKHNSQHGSRVQVIKYNVSMDIEIVGEVRYFKPVIRGAIYVWADDDSDEYTNIRKDGSLGLRFNLDD